MTVKNTHISENITLTYEQNHFTGPDEHWIQSSIKLYAARTILLLSYKVIFTVITFMTFSTSLRHFEPYKLTQHRRKRNSEWISFTIQEKSMNYFCTVQKILQVHSTGRTECGSGLCPFWKIEKALQISSHQMVGYGLKLMSRDSSVGIALGYGLNDQGS